MLAWLLENYLTIIVLLLLLALVSFIILRMVKEKKAGKTSCGHGCANCAMHGRCHEAQRKMQG